MNFTEFANKFENVLIESGYRKYMVIFLDILISIMEKQNIF